MIVGDERLVVVWNSLKYVSIVHTKIAMDKATAQGYFSMAPITVTYALGHIHAVYSVECDNV